MLSVGDHGSPQGALWVTESLYLVVRVTRLPPKTGLLCAELRVHPHRLQLGEHLREEAWLCVDPQHRAAGIRDEVRTVVLSNFLYLDGCCEARQQIPLAKHRPVGWTVKCPVMPDSGYKSITQSYKVLCIIGLHLCQQHTDEIVSDFLSFQKVFDNSNSEIRLTLRWNQPLWI